MSAGRPQRVVGWGLVLLVLGAGLVVLSIANASDRPSISCVDLLGLAAGGASQRTPGQWVPSGGGPAAAVGVAVVGPPVARHAAAPAVHTPPAGPPGTAAALSPRPPPTPLPHPLPPRRPYDPGAGLAGSATLAVTCLLEGSLMITQ